MFGVSSFELLVIILLAVVVLGPERLPKAIRTVTRLLSELRRVSTDLQRTINVEAYLQEQNPRPAPRAGGNPPPTGEKGAAGPPYADEETGESPAPEPVRGAEAEKTAEKILPAVQDKARPTPENDSEAGA
ncbi:MAG: twin-arginine translocase subunit TatB [Deltaproteobacteria bacterium]|jgi:sec-independent protein translocase protein TatB|nr:twin-arginine translocase subunit TatB [Deltaproteobacteria bacterium]